jgi:hydroxyisourate hydrolase
MSQLTTHILNTALGKPAAGVNTLLEYNSGSNWEKVASGVTNNDGRIPDLLEGEKILSKGIYRLTFNTGAYFASMKVNTFYPQVIVEFEISDASHYHVPLLISPYGYSTYRGS